MIEHAQKPASGTIASIVGVITLLFGASGVAGELQSALNRMWDGQPENTGGIWGAIKQRLSSFGMVLGVGFLLLVSLVISAVLAALAKFSAGFLPMPQFVIGSGPSPLQCYSRLESSALVFIWVSRPSDHPAVQRARSS